MVNGNGRRPTMPENESFKICDYTFIRKDGGFYIQKYDGEAGFFPDDLIQKYLDKLWDDEF